MKHLLLPDHTAWRGNMIDRNTGMNGTGVDENVTFTLNTVDRHAVAYDARAPLPERQCERNIAG